MNEVELAKRASEGSADALRILLDSVSGRLMRVAWQMCRDKHLAEDLCQESFIKITDPKVLSAYRGTGSLEGYLLSCGTRAMISLLRTRGYGGWFAVDSLDARVDGESLVGTEQEEALSGELSPLLREAMLELPERARLVVLLITVGDLSYAETADALGIPTGTVRSTYSRAREQLREALQGSAIDSKGGSPQ